jgi:hypothetical protein
MNKIINKNAIFINLGYRKNSHLHANIICPCITKQSHSLYCLKKN